MFLVYLLYFLDQRIWFLHVKVKLINEKKCTWNQYWYSSNSVKTVGLLNLISYFTYFNSNHCLYNRPPTFSNITSNKRCLKTVEWFSILYLLYCIFDTSIELLFNTKKYKNMKRSSMLIPMHVSIQCGCVSIKYN